MITPPPTPSHTDAIATHAAKEDSKQRLVMIDVAKGIGILLIVLGHNPIFSRNFDGLADLLSAFRLPFFFFISGTMLSIGKRSIGKVALERADAWLKPVAVMIVAMGVGRIALGRSTLETTMLELTYATGFTLMWTAMWFLPHLWLLYVVTTWVLTSLKSLSNTPWKRALLVIALLSTGHFILKQFDSGLDHPACRRALEFNMELLNCGLPFSADLLLITSAFFLLGHFMSAWARQFKINLGLLLLALIVMSVCQWFFDADVDFNYRRYDDLVICTLQAYSGIYIMLCICSVMARFAKVSSLLAYCGRGSLFILIFHASMVLKIAEFMPALIPSDLIVGSTAFFFPLLASLLIWNICQRVEILSLLMLPIKNRANNRQIKPGSSSAASAN